MAHTYDPSIQEVEAGELWWEASLDYRDCLKNKKKKLDKKF